MFEWFEQLLSDMSRDDERPTNPAIRATLVLAHPLCLAGKRQFSLFYYLVVAVAYRLRVLLVGGRIRQLGSGGAEPTELGNFGW